MDRLKARAGVTWSTFLQGLRARDGATVTRSRGDYVGHLDLWPYPRRALRALAFTGPKRLERLAGGPSIAPSSIRLRHVSSGMACSRRPASRSRVLARLLAEVNKALLIPDHKRELLELGAAVEPWITTPEEFPAEIRSEYRIPSS